MSSTSIPQVPSPAAPASYGGASHEPLRPDTPMGGTPVPRRRKRSLLVVGVLCVVTGGLAFSWMLSSAGDRVEVVAVARDVPVGQALVAEDLTVAALPADPALHPIPAGEKKSLIGRRAGIDLKQGSLLTSAQLATGSLLREGEDLVALTVERGHAPIEALAPGDDVKVVSAPAPDADADASKELPADIKARVVKVGRANASGSVVVQVAAASTDSSLLAAQSAGGHVSVVLVSKGRG
ncbi:SAF domain-containing protein [Streptomyces sp. NBC_01789]|uniref:SAF domain-containing protein n=1 Tax=Streptomyces sp. NBC_01789 TaxID=2975941 RepID=UPI002252D958|nr:SAF domain-containing protein [Streptomyces sp. NBC_01789]MCX4451691.1 SAF domain-containing protein [Streptomyces sp. NBC_01789]